MPQAYPKNKETSGLEKQTFTGTYQTHSKLSSILVETNMNCVLKVHW